MRQWAALAAATLALAHPVDAQQPTLAPALERLEHRDTVVAVWLFGAPAYALDEVARAAEELGGRLRRRSRWLHAVSADLPTPALAAARRRPEFRHLQPVARFRGRPEPAEPVRFPLGPRVPPAAADTLEERYGFSAMPMRQLNLFPLARQGLTAAGVTIAVLDTGFETELSAFAKVNVLAQRDFVCRPAENDPPGCSESVVRNEPGDAATASQHGTQVWSLLAAYVPDTIIGLAPDAGYLLAKTEDVRSETRAEEDNWVAAVEWADSLGADVVSSSLGYLRFDDGFSYRPSDLNGDVAVTTVAADIAAQRGIVVVTAAGNGGPPFRSLVTPADGDSVIAVGAEDSQGAPAPLSSRGPTADGRLKPDVTAPGVGIFVVDPLSASGSRVSGTSYSTPLVAGVAALMRQVHPTASPMDVLAALTRTGTNRATPDSSVGWGRPDGAAAVVFPRGIEIVTPGDTLLDSVTPEFAWAVPGVPLFAQPVRYRLRVARDATFGTILLDTAVAGTSARLIKPLRPGERLVFTVTGVAQDSVTFMTLPSPEHVAPPWATLLTLDDPAGVAIRDLRPVLRWRSPEVTEPPGPFSYDLAVIRTDDGIVELVATRLTSTEYRPPRDLERNTPYRWRVVSRLGGDSAATDSRGTFLIVDGALPSVTLLFQNFPNPFPNPTTGRTSTCIWFDLARGGRVRLDVLDLRGHVVRNLVPGDGNFPTTLGPGRYGRPAPGRGGPCDPRLEWDGTARDGSVAPQGIYLVRLDAPDGVLFRRIVFVGLGR